MEGSFFLNRKSYMNIPTFFLFSINNRAFHHLFLYETF